MLFHRYISAINTPCCSTVTSVPLTQYARLYDVLFLLDRLVLARRSSQFLLDYLKVIMTATVCLALIINR